MAACLFVASSMRSRIQIMVTEKTAQTSSASALLLLCPALPVGSLLYVRIVLNYEMISYLRRKSRLVRIGDSPTAEREHRLLSTCLYAHAVSNWNITTSTECSSLFSNQTRRCKQFFIKVGSTQSSVVVPHKHFRTYVVWLFNPR